MLVLSTRSALLLNGLVNNKAVASFEKLEQLLAQNLFSNTDLKHNLLDKLLGLMVTMSRVVRETQTVMHPGKTFFDHCLFWAFKLTYGGHLREEDHHAVSLYT